jgi:protein TonB
LSQITADDRRTWGMAGAIALVVHGALVAVILAAVVPAKPPMPEPVVLVELPPEGAPSPAVAAMQPEAQPQPDYVPPEAVTPPVKVPPVAAPLPKDPVVLPPPPLPARRTNPAPAAAPAAVNPVVTTPVGTGTGSSTTPGNDPKARAQEADYFALVSAHLNRRKRYPTEAKKARQQGIVTVRFTVSRDGSVSAVSIKRSSGHDLLDQATLELLQRVAPLPRMPASMQRDSVTLSLPIDYSLKTN